MCIAIGIGWFGSMWGHLGSLKEIHIMIISPPKFAPIMILAAPTSTPKVMLCTCDYNLELKVFAYRN